jgi:uncharacterized protein (DUF4415 family)
MKQGFFSRLTGIPPLEHPKPPPATPMATPVPPPPAVEEIVRDIVRQGLPAAPRKAAVSLRLDADVLDWFKGRGAGYQTRINAVLRAYMEAAGRA